MLLRKRPRGNVSRSISLPVARKDGSAFSFGHDTHSPTLKLRTKVKLQSPQKAIDMPTLGDDDEADTKWIMTDTISSLAPPLNDCVKKTVSELPLPLVLDEEDEGEDVSEHSVSSESGRQAACERDDVQKTPQKPHATSFTSNITTRYPTTETLQDPFPCL